MLRNASTAIRRRVRTGSRRTATAVAATALAVSALALTACSSSGTHGVDAAVGTQRDAVAMDLSHRVATSQSAGTCSPSFDKGWTSVDLVITNNTSFALTFDPALSGPSSGHWNERPATTLGPGQCEVVNAYAPTDVHIFNLNVVYSTPWGDYMPFEGTANSTSPSFNPNVFAGVPEYHKNNYYWSGTIDSRYSISSSGQVGLLHTHFTLSLS